ncbi:hypothetical protein XENOCAPTIV_026219 [Xenoophorus captivus]|uniref:Taste receptor type 1 member 1 n=1 Tax=Xenoophorus captivus TaxID=1517983 RepID=A0ABV0QBJ7_9TELE
MTCPGQKCHIHRGLCSGCVQTACRLCFVVCFFCAGYDWQVLLHRCSSSESNQLGFIWSGNPEINLVLKAAVETVWSPVSLVSCSEECGNSSLDAPALRLQSASNSKPNFSRAAST